MKVTNGKDVARLLVDEYLNCHPTGHKKFMESMAKEQQEIKDNYTYLGFAWLKGLSEVRYYDLRNEASKLMADDLCLHVKEQPENIESPSVLMSIFNIPFSRKLQSSEIFLKSLQYKILILLLQPKYSHRRKPIPYICGLGAKVGCEHV